MPENLQRLVDDLALRIGRPVLLEDHDQRVLAYSEQDGPMDDIRRESILRRHTTVEVRERYRAAGIFAARGPLRIPGSAGALDRVCVPARHRERLLGFLWLIDSPPVSDSDVAVAFRTAGALALTLFHDSLAAGLSSRRELEAVSAVLFGDWGAAEEGARLLADEGGFGGPVTVMVVRPSEVGGALGSPGGGAAGGRSVAGGATAGRGATDGPASAAGGAAASGAITGGETAGCGATDGSTSAASGALAGGETAGGAVASGAAARASGASAVVGGQSPAVGALVAPVGGSGSFAGGAAAGAHPSAGGAYSGAAGAHSRAFGAAGGAVGGAVAAVGGDDGDDASTASKLERGLLAARARLSSRPLHFVRGDHGVLLCSGRAPDPDEVRYLVGVPSVIGVGASRERVADAAGSYREALHAAEVALRVPGHGPSAHWGSLGVYRMLSAGQVELHSGLERLLDDPANQALLQTLETYLDLAGSVVATARALRLHRTSLYYRLQRVEELAGTNLKSGDERLMLHLSLKLARLAGRYPTATAGR